MSTSDPIAYEGDHYEARRNVPFSERDPSVPYFPSPRSRLGNPIFRVVSRLLPCSCRRSVIETCDFKGSAVGPHLDLVLDAEPVADGRYVVVENAFGGQAARPFAADPARYAGCRRYQEHVCGGEK